MTLNEMVVRGVGLGALAGREAASTLLRSLLLWSDGERPSPHSGAWLDDAPYARPEPDGPTPQDTGRRARERSS